MNLRIILLFVISAIFFINFCFKHPNVHACAFFYWCTTFRIYFSCLYFIKPWKLSRFDPDKWGMSVCTVDGQRFTLGDVNEPFTIQSCSKPFTYGINVDKLGQEVVDKYIGQEPSGRDFNEICLDSKSQFLLNYRKVASSRLSWLVAHFRIFRLFMKWEFDGYVLWPLG